MVWRLLSGMMNVLDARGMFSHLSAQRKKISKLTLFQFNQWAVLMLTIMRILKSNKVHNGRIIRQWAVKCLATKQTNDKKISVIHTLVRGPAAVCLKPRTMMLILLLLLESKVWEASEFGLMREINKKIRRFPFPSFSALQTEVKNSPFNNAGCPFCQKPSLKNLPLKRIIPSEQAWWLMESLPSCSRLHRNAIEGLLMDAARTYCRCVIAKEVPHRFIFIWSAYWRCKSTQSVHLWSKPIDLTASDWIWWPLAAKFWWFIREINPAVCVTRIDWKAKPPPKKEGLRPWCYQQRVGIQKSLWKCRGACDACYD